MLYTILWSNHKHPYYRHYYWKWWCLTVDKSCLNFVKGNFVDTQEKCFISLRCLSHCEEEISWSIISESQAWSLQRERPGGVRAPGDVGELEGGGGGSRPEHKVKPRWCWSKGIRSCASDDNGTLMLIMMDEGESDIDRFITTQIYNN